VNTNYHKLKLQNCKHITQQLSASDRHLAET